MAELSDFLALLVAYVLENLIVHVIDIVIVGVGYYLVRFGWKQPRSGFGVVMLLVWVASLYGSTMGDTPSFDWWQPIAAAFGALLAKLNGWQRRRLARRGPTNRTAASAPHFIIWIVAYWVGAPLVLGSISGNGPRHAQI